MIQCDATHHQKVSRLGPTKCVVLQSCVFIVGVQILRLVDNPERPALRQDIPGAGQPLECCLCMTRAAAVNEEAPRLAFTRSWRLVPTDPHYMLRSCHGAVHCFHTAEDSSLSQNTQ